MFITGFMNTTHEIEFTLMMRKKYSHFLAEHRLFLAKREIYSKRVVSDTTADAANHPRIPW